MFKTLTTTNTLDSSRVSMLLRLFMESYRRGVEEAACLEDEGACLEAVERTSKPYCFGSPKLGIRRDAIFWGLKLAEMASEIKLYRSWELYRYGMSGYGRNYLTVGLVIAQDFYNKGMLDYYACEKVDLLKVLKNPNVILTRTGTMRASSKRLGNMVCEMCYNRMDMEEKCEEIKYLLRPIHYQAFITRFSRIGWNGKM